MKHYADIVLNTMGLPVNGASITIRVAASPAGSGALATIYSDNIGTAATNPVTTSVLGRFDFYVADGRYDISVTGSGITSYTLADVEILDSTEKAAGDSTWNVATAEIDTLRLDSTNADVQLTRSAANTLQLATGDKFLLQNLNNVRYVNEFAGTDAGAKIATAIADGPSTGVVVVVTGSEGAQTSAANPFAGVTKPVHLILGASTITTSVAWDLPSNVTIEGVGPTSVIKLATGVNSQYAITSSSKSNIHLRYFKIDGNKANQTPSGGDRTGGITFTAVTNFSIRDLEIADPYHHGIQVKGASARFAISGNYIHDNTNGSLAIVGNAAVGDTIDDFDIEGNILGPATGANCIFTTGFAAGPTWGVSRGRIRGNTCFQAGDIGIEVGQGSDNVTVTGNTVYVTSAARTGILARGSRNCAIVGNALYSDGSGTQKAIYIWSETGDSTLSKHTIVGHNTLRGFTGASTVAFEVGSAAAGAVDDVSFLGNKAPSATTKFTISANATNVQRFDNDDGINSSTGTNLDFLPGSANYARFARRVSVDTSGTASDPSSDGGFHVKHTSSQAIIAEASGTNSIGVSLRHATQNWSLANRSDLSNDLTFRDITGGADRFRFSTGGLFTAASLNLGGATLLDILTATASLNFDFSAGGITEQDLTIACTGAAVGDVVALGLPADLQAAGLAFTAFVSGADVVTVRGHDVTSSGANPAAATVRVTVFKF